MNRRLCRSSKTSDAAVYRSASVIIGITRIGRLVCRVTSLESDANRQE